jgi:hypothetical protein
LENVQSPSSLPSPVSPSLLPTTDSFSSSSASSSSASSSSSSSGGGGGGARAGSPRTSGTGVAPGKVAASTSQSATVSQLRGIFADAQKEIFDLMRNDPYVRFCKTAEYKTAYQHIMAKEQYKKEHAQKKSKPSHQKSKSKWKLGKKVTDEIKDKEVEMEGGL